MFKYACLNPIANVGLKNFDENYVKTDDVNEAEGILVRSAVMHEMDFSKNLLAVARAGAGVNNIPLDKLAQQTSLREEHRWPKAVMSAPASGLACNWRGLEQQLWGM